MKDIDRSLENSKFVEAFDANSVGTRIWFAKNHIGSMFFVDSGGILEKTTKTTKQIVQIGEIVLSVRDVYWEIVDITDEITIVDSESICDENRIELYNCLLGNSYTRVSESPAYLEVVISDMYILRLDRSNRYDSTDDIIELTINGSNHFHYYSSINYGDSCNNP